MSDRRTSALSRSALIVAGGGALVALTQRPEITSSLAGQVLLVVAAGAILVGIVMAARALMRRGDEPE